MVIRDDRVFIGLPVYNSVGTIEGSVRSILRQTHANWVLVIRDNQSNDGTFELCCEIAKEDPRILVHRNEANIGAWPNFIRLIQQSDTTYFKWHAADDEISDDFLEVNIQYLNAHSNAVGSFSKDATRSALEYGIGYHRHDFCGSFDDKFRKFLDNAPNSNAAFYALFWSEVKNVLDPEEEISDSLIQDWKFVLKALNIGDIVRAPEAETLMGERGFSTVKFSWLRLLPTTLNRVFPYLSFIKGTLPLLRNLNSSNKKYYLGFLLKQHLNIYKGLVLYWLRGNRNG